LPLASPLSLVFGSLVSPFVSCPPVGRRRAPAGCTASIFAFGLLLLSCTSAAAQSTVFVANAAGSVSSLLSSGAAQSPAVSGGGVGVAVGTGDIVWSINTGGNGVSTFGDSGAYLASYAPSGIGSASALAIDGNGIVWLAQPNNVFALTTAGAAVNAAGLAPDANLSSPAGMLVDASGNLWITNSGNSTVSEVVGVAAPTVGPLVDQTPMTVPGAPTISGVTGGITQVTVAFTAPASDGGSAITTYTATSSPGGLTASGSGSPLVVTGLTNGTPFTFTVKATNGVGTGPASAASASVTPAMPPNAPTVVKATSSDAAAMVSFTAPSNNGGAIITLYTVTSSPGGFTGTGRNGPIWVTGLTNNTSYTFTVVATNSSGSSASSASSTSATPSTQVGTTKVTNIVVTPTITQASVAFTKPAGASTVTVFATPSGAFTVIGGQSATGTSSPLVISGLTNGESYTVTAYYTTAVAQVSLPATSAVFTAN